MNAQINELAEKTVRLFSEKELQLATAESCTGGMIAAAITDISGASAVFHCGIVAYANEVKIGLLGVSKETIEQYSAVSKETAAEMASGARRISGADIAVAVTGNAGPLPSEGKPVGEVYVAVESEWFKKVVPLDPPALSGDIRRQIRELTVKKALCLALQAAELKEAAV